jgi:hypothetical protein
VAELAGGVSRVIPPCPPSVRSHASDHDDSRVIDSETAWVIRYKCPFATCEEHFGSTSGIRHHWKIMHVNAAVPEITAARTRIRVDARDAVQASHVTL